MDKTVSLQIQAVVYNNNIAALKKAIYAMTNAVRVEREKVGSLSHVKFLFGDASETPVMPADEITRINEEIAPYMTLEYRFFGFNTGYGKGNNMLAMDSDSDYLLIMNPDIIASPRTLIDLMQPFENKETGIVEARQTPIEHHKEYNAESKETSWATGACFMVPTKLFKQMAGFDDTSFFMYCEDVDLSWRIRLAGYKIIYQPLSPAYHAKRLNTDGHWMPTAAESLYSAQSRLMMAYKWSNNSLLEELIQFFSTSDLPEHHKAVDHFLDLQKTGRLPKQLDAEHKVSTFVGYDYAENRFTL